jgi:FAD/FMN-containing dehydrogenase
MSKFLLLGLYLSVHSIQAAPQKYSDIVSCLSSSGVPQDFPGTSDFTQHVIPHNLRLNFTPVALAVPSTVPQVQAAVVCASKVGVKVNPKSGGHSYASHSLGGEDGHLVIDLKYFRDTKVDPSTYVASIGPGARLGNVALNLFKQNGRAMAHGICPG